MAFNVGVGSFFVVASQPALCIIIRLLEISTGVSVCCKIFTFRVGNTHVGISCCNDVFSNIFDFLKKRVGGSLASTRVHIEIVPVPTPRPIGILNLYQCYMLMSKRKIFTIPSYLPKNRNDLRMWFWLNLAQ